MFESRVLLRAGLTLAMLAALALCLPAAWAETEIKEYKGEGLSPFDRGYDNSIKGPQKVDPKKFRLQVSGEVAKPLSLTYDQVLALPSHERLLTMPCVEGWDERLLYQGVRLDDLLVMAEPKPGAKTVIFFAADGYSSALPLSYVRQKDILLGYKINGLTLDGERGFPFQVAAQHKLGYKWVKWVTRIELSAEPYLGYWEQRGYDDEADATP